MKKAFSIFVVICVLAFSSIAGAVAFTPSDADVFDLEHASWYTWRINWATPAGEEITGATLKIYDIYNWTSEPADQLNIWLLDEPVSGNVAPGIYRGYDSQAVSDYFATYTLAGDKAWIAAYSDPDDNRSLETLTYDLFSMGLGGDFIDFASNSVFGFGFDPDCHYFNSRIELTVTTAQVPEPSSLLLLGTGLIGLVGFRRRISS